MLMQNKFLGLGFSIKTLMNQKKSPNSLMANGFLQKGLVVEMHHQFDRVEAYLYMVAI